MIHRIAQFEKVSFETFKKDMYKLHPDNNLSDESIKRIYDFIELPKRSTKGSAGFDFSFPFNKLTLNPGNTIVIPTGIRVRIDEGWLLAIVPRSSYGFKYRAQLDNTIGIIDSDYYYSDNEGHIIVKMTNDSKHHDTLICEHGDRFVQGIFIPYGITVDDEADGIRNGGFGSTNEK